MWEHAAADTQHVVLFSASRYSVWRAAHRFSHRHGGEEEEEEGERGG